MEHYPSAYIEHNLPLIHLSGLTSDIENEKRGLSIEAVSSQTLQRFEIDLPNLPDSISQSILDEILRFDGKDLPWSIPATNVQGSSSAVFSFSQIGRSVTFPRRKAAPAAQAPSSDPINLHAPILGQVRHELHSTISPLSSTSPLYPDGLFSTIWMDKHQRQVPSILLCFVHIDTEASSVSEDDAKIRSELVALKNHVARSGFRTRLVVVAVGTSRDQQSDLEERTSAIRRSVGLDAKTAFFVLPAPGSRLELSSFVNRILTTLQPVCADFYRDLTKHARRKKGRSQVVSSAGELIPLSIQGWNVRYEFKLGIFAEYRQEMDVAERHLSLVLDELFSPEGVLQTTDSTSKRWDEMKCFADVAAIRLVRSQLWRNLTTASAESWLIHRDRIRYLTEAKGRSTSDASHARWEARWAEIMAQLISYADVPEFRVTDLRQIRSGDVEKRAASELSSSDESEEENDKDYDQKRAYRTKHNQARPIWITPEKAYEQNDRLNLLCYLHHPGYWLLMAKKWTVLQRMRQGDQDGSTEGIKDDIIRLDIATEKEFQVRKQKRFTGFVAFEKAILLLEQGPSDEAFEILSKLWKSMPWRQDHWSELMEPVINELFDLAIHLKKPRFLTELKWALLCQDFGSRDRDTTKSLEADDSANKPIILESANYDSCPVSATFAFAADEAYSGDTVSCQFTLTSKFFKSTANLRFDQLTFVIGKNERTIILDNVEDDIKSTIQQLEVIEDANREDSGNAELSQVFRGRANLGITSNQTKVFNFSIALADVESATTWAITKMGLSTKIDEYTLQYNLTDSSKLSTKSWFLDQDKDLLARALTQPHSEVLNVLPKPPRIDIGIANAKTQYFASETNNLNFFIRNNEKAGIFGRITIHTLEHFTTTLSIDSGASEVDSPSAGLSILLPKTLPSESHEFNVNFTAPIETTEMPLHITVDYNIGDKPSLITTKTDTFTFKIGQPFTAMVELLPRLDTSPWQSYFVMPSIKEIGVGKAEGYRQEWALFINLRSLALESVIIEDLSLRILETSDNVLCQPIQSHVNRFPVIVKAGAIHDATLRLFTQRISLDDRRPSVLTLDLHVTWRRNSSSTQVYTTIPLETITLAPPEPRVLCTTLPLLQSDKCVIPNSRQVTYTIENPSMHFLTFTIEMESSDQFAFSGPKLKNIALAPLSRVDVKYVFQLLIAPLSLQHSTSGLSSKIQSPVDAESDTPVTSARRTKDMQGLEIWQGDPLFDKDTSTEGNGEIGNETQPSSAVSPSTILPLHVSTSDTKEVVGKKRYGKWIYPILRVTDNYFHKSLRVMHAAEGTCGPDGDPRFNSTTTRNELEEGNNGRRAGEKGVTDLGVVGIDGNVRGSQKGGGVAVWIFCE